MVNVKAPIGYEGCVFWVDGSRAWQAAAKPVGANYWTHTGAKFGHADSPKADVLRKAEANISTAVGLGFVR